jgi:hypothetical protein
MTNPSSRSPVLPAEQGPSGRDLSTQDELGAGPDTHTAATGMLALSSLASPARFLLAFLCRHGFLSVNAVLASWVRKYFERRVSSPRTNLQAQMAGAARLGF